MNEIDGMTERQAKSLLNDISAIFRIGGSERTPYVILTRIKIAKDRSDCLSKVEKSFYKHVSTCKDLFDKL